MWLWRNPDNVTHQLLSIDQIWWWSTALTWSKWGCRRLADNIWLLAHDNNNNLRDGTQYLASVRHGFRSRWTTPSQFSQPQLARGPKVPAGYGWSSCLCRGCASNLELTVGRTAKYGSPQCHLPTQLNCFRRNCFNNRPTWCTERVRGAVRLSARALYKSAFTFALHYRFQNLTFSHQSQVSILKVVLLSYLRTSLRPFLPRLRSCTVPSPLILRLGLLSSKLSNKSTLTDSELSNAVYTTTIWFLFDGRSTAYQRSLRSQWRILLATVTLTYLFI